MSDDEQQIGEERPGETELTRLADGSLPASERDALRTLLARSPELQARLREQERAVGLMQATSELAAPASLRASVQALSDGPGARARRRARRARVGAGERRRIAVWRPRASIALVALAAALVVVVSIALHGGASPTVDRTARLALAAATGPAPAVDAADHELLAVRASGIPFPSYGRLPGWRASGVRHDAVDGRHVTTVFYAVGTARAGYSIVSGAALPMPAGRRVRGPGGVLYVLAAADGGQLITWRRSGHTCVIASRSMSRRTLLTLAAADEQA